MLILCITVVSGCRTKITVVSGYRTNNYRGFWLPYRNYRGGQLPCKTYCALPWSLVTVQKLPWWPVTVRKLWGITAVAGYRGKRYRDEKPLPREALENIASTSFCQKTYRGFFTNLTGPHKLGPEKKKNQHKILMKPSRDCSY